MSEAVDIRWYVVQTQVNGELKAAQNLVRQGFEVYLPRYLKRRRHARKIDFAAKCPSKKPALQTGYYNSAIDEIAVSICQQPQSSVQLLTIDVVYRDLDIICLAGQRVGHIQISTNPTKRSSHRADCCTPKDL